ncbi:MAG: flavodoxin-dependent (E)-4-hydroxy-3-methylbut-2-enyl-diphosphate synthase, partial [Terriglobia bacterium]
MNGTVGIGIGDKSIGAGAPVLVQSMTTTDTADVAATIAQITALEAAGCELVRVAVPDAAAAKALREVKERVGVPIIADVHYRPTVALAALEAGADKIRINPGTIKDQKEVEGIVSVAAEKGIPVRIGVNSGSLHPRYRDSGSDLAAALVNSALEYVRIFEDVGFDRIVLSVKSSSVVDTVRAYRILARKTRYPLHIGVTEAGTLISGTVKSAVGLGLLLFDGIGDTIRVSLTAPPVQE